MLKRRTRAESHVFGVQPEYASRGGLALGVQPYDGPAGWTPVGEGAHRAVIPNPARMTVYKIETETGRNQREHGTPPRTPYPRRTYAGSSACVNQ